MKNICPFLLDDRISCNPTQLMSGALDFDFSQSLIFQHQTFRRVVGVLYGLRFSAWDTAKVVYTSGTSADFIATIIPFLHPMVNSGSGFGSGFSTMGRHCFWQEERETKSFSPRIKRGLIFSSVQISHQYNG